MKEASPTETTLPSWGEEAYSIKRHGQTLTSCESEPVQTPGCIQSYGALLVLRISDLIIVQASENTLQHLAESPENLLGKPASHVVGESNTRDVSFCYEHGANAYHIKPVSHPAHLQILKNIFAYWLNCAELPCYEGS